MSDGVKTIKVDRTHKQTITITIRDRSDEEVVEGQANVDISFEFNPKILTPEDIKHTPAMVIFQKMLAAAQGHQSQQPAPVQREGRKIALPSVRERLLSDRAALEAKRAKRRTGRTNK